MRDPKHIVGIFQAVDEEGNTYEVRHISVMKEYTALNGKTKRLRGGYHYETSIVIEDGSTINDSLVECLGDDMFEILYTGQRLRKL